MHSNETRAVPESNKCIFQKQYTMLNLLDKAEDELLQQVKKNCKYEIRRAEREGAKYTMFSPCALSVHSETD